MRNIPSHGSEPVVDLAELRKYPSLARYVLKRWYNHSERVIAEAENLQVLAKERRRLR